MLFTLQTALFLVSLSLTKTAEDLPQISLIVAEVGGNVTLKCQVTHEDGKFFHWHKQVPGYLAQTVATGAFSSQRLQEQFKNSRFHVTEGATHYSLTIGNIVKEDEATYFCQTGSAYLQTFVTGFFLAVKDQTPQKTVDMKQSPEKTSVRLGDSMTLQCSLFSNSKGNDTIHCPDEHSVHWFRAGSGHSYPGIIYTPSTTATERRSCAYSLSKTIQQSSDAGTYYCAVVLCGEILFGEGTVVETKQENSLLVYILGALLALSVIVIAILVFAKN